MQLLGFCLHAEGSATCKFPLGVSRIRAVLAKIPLAGLSVDCRQVFMGYPILLIVVDAIRPLGRHAKLAAKKGSGGQA